MGPIARAGGVRVEDSLAAQGGQTLADLREAIRSAARPTQAARQAEIQECPHMVLQAEAGHQADPQEVRPVTRLASHRTLLGPIAPSGVRLSG